MFVVQRERRVKPRYRGHLVDVLLDGLFDEFTGLIRPLREAIVVTLVTCLELLGAILEITEQTASVTGRRDVVIKICDECNLDRRQPRHALVSSLWHQFYPLKIDPGIVGTGGQ